MPTPQRWTLSPSKTHQRPTLLLRFSSLHGFITFAAVSPVLLPADLRAAKLMKPFSVTDSSKKLCSMFSKSSPRSWPCFPPRTCYSEIEKRLAPTAQATTVFLLASKRCNYGGTELPVGSAGPLTAGVATAAAPAGRH